MKYYNVILQIINGESVVFHKYRKVKSVLQLIRFVEAKNPTVKVGYINVYDYVTKLKLVSTKDRDLLTWKVKKRLFFVTFIRQTAVGKPQSENRSRNTVMDTQHGTNAVNDLHIKFI